MLGPTMLRVAGQQCCVRLHGPKNLTGFKLYATSTNIVVAPCKRTQHVGPNNIACCWPTMLRPFARALRPRPYEAGYFRKLRFFSKNGYYPDVAGVFGH